MKSRALSASVASSSTESSRLLLRMALWLLDRPRLGRSAGIKRLAGRLLKQPARRGVVEAQSRLGQLLCRDCGNARDRRIGLELLRQAARAGDARAQLELGRQYCQPRQREPLQARHWLELAAAQGSHEAARLLGRLNPTG
ncbi:sel1 repeat family protein [Pseudomonas sp. R-28-1W-6]|uniref:tetratricopeptide repeat protein n=1 Tax=Pseudomonas sp. R-28-1W-6 TaxID=2650101 RepID=UPI00136658B8|nr:sel1 repeat family protein [Pseudomonas sp. R-28-1W-6]MWV13205.1 sel1 repeat family protein [Pseudomonas sp. R-28-1W-6]